MATAVRPWITGTIKEDPPSWVWERDDSFLLTWTGTIFLTEVSNAKYTVPYRLDVHFALGLHDHVYLYRFHGNDKFQRPSK